MYSMVSLGTSTVTYLKVAKFSSHTHTHKLELCDDGC